jgi:hypothetical protein
MKEFASMGINRQLPRSVWLGGWTTVILMLLPMPGHAQQKPVTRPDPVCFAADPSAATEDIGVHYRSAQTQGSEALMSALQLRLRSLFACSALTGADFERAYWDITAAVGGVSAVRRSACFGDDARQLLLDATPYSPARPRGREQWLANSELLVTRTFNCLTREGQPAFFASVSSSLARSAGAARPTTAARAPATAASTPATAASTPATAARTPTTAARTPATAASTPATAARTPATAAASSGPAAPVASGGPALDVDLTGTWITDDNGLQKPHVLVLSPAGPGRWAGPISGGEFYDATCEGVCTDWSHLTFDVVAPGKLKVTIKTREKLVDKSGVVTAVRDSPVVYVNEGSYTANELLPAKEWKAYPFRRRK